MKNILIVIAACLITISGNAQEMSWIPSKYIQKQVAVDATDCDENVICYTLQYIPSHSGKLTSYTTGFIMDCDQGISAVKANDSNTLNDHSQEVNGCEEYGKIILHCSGNRGDLSVEAGVPVYLHQICVQTHHKTSELMIEESELAGLTSSINMENGNPITEYISYRPYKVLNSAVHCQLSSDNLSLEAELKDEATVALSWEPARETTDGIYEVYQSFENGIFEMVSTVQSRILTEQSTEKYKLDLELEESGEYTYKIVYKLKDGSSFTSNHAAVFFESQDFNFSMSVTPNPTNQYIHIKVTARTKMISLNILDASGKLVKTAQLVSNETNTIDLKDLPVGIYSIVTLSGKDVLTDRILLVE